MQEDAPSLDEAFPPAAGALAALLRVEGECFDADAGVAMRLEEFTIETPIEMDIAADGGRCLTLGIVPPLYYVEVGIEPVFHRVRLTAVIDQKPALNGEHTLEP